MAICLRKRKCAFLAILCTILLFARHTAYPGLSASPFGSLTGGCFRVCGARGRR